MNQGIEVIENKFLNYDNRSALFVKKEAELHVSSFIYYMLKYSERPIIEWLVLLNVITIDSKLTDRVSSPLGTPIVKPFGFIDSPSFMFRGKYFNQLLELP